MQDASRTDSRCLVRLLANDDTDSEFRIPFSNAFMLLTRGTKLKLLIYMLIILLCAILCLLGKTLLLNVHYLRLCFSVTLSPRSQLFNSLSRLVKYWQYYRVFPCVCEGHAFPRLCAISVCILPSLYDNVVTGIVWGTQNLRVLHLYFRFSCGLLCMAFTCVVP